MTAPRASRGTRLEIAENLALPLDAVTSTIVIFGGKGMGKTNLLSVIAEEVARTGHRFSLIDPMGVCWGLRHSADGKGKGIEVLILGGRHGDMPIEPGGGAVVADLVVDEDISVVIDISRRADGRSWGKNEKIRFVRDYCTRLFERQGERRRPLLQIIDEAARFVPQMIRANEMDTAACMGAVAQMVEEGRNNGIGVCLISQRSARMSKDVTELADCMMAFRTIGPNSVGAIVDWLGEHVPKERQKDLIEKLRSLPRGSALVVSPGWLEFEGVAAMRPRQTFDSSSTPKSGQERRTAGKGAQPDLARYQQRMVETIERAKAEDPRELKKQLAEAKSLIAKLEKKPAPVAAPAPPKRVEVPILKDAQVAKLEAVCGRIRKTAEELLALGNGIISEIIVHTAKAEMKAAPPALVRQRQRTAVLASALDRALETASSMDARAPSPPLRQKTAPSEGIARPQQAILDALAWLGAVIGVPRGTRSIVAFLADTSPKSSYFEKNVSGLRAGGWIDYPSQGDLALTLKGGHAANQPDIPTTPDHLHSMIYRKLPSAQAAIIRELIAVYPEALSRPALAGRAGSSDKSSYFEKNVSALRSIGLIDYPTKGDVVALPLLFLE